MPNRPMAASMRPLNVLIGILSRRAASAATPPAALSALIACAASDLVSRELAMPRVYRANT